MASESEASCGGSPFHAGERELQRRVGMQEKMEGIGRRVLRRFMPDQHREFFAGLPFLILGTVDDRGWPGASIITGLPGFVTTPDATMLRIDARPEPGDPAAANLEPGTDVAVLGIDLATRRRNRANGLAAAVDGAGFAVAVKQSFGNCPKYIQARDWRPLLEGEQGPPRAAEGASLGPAERALIGAADTFFIASRLGSAREDQSRGVDASHRGGKPGFVAFEDERTLTVPDYSGNSYFNTLGNLLIDPRCGLLFIEFEAGTTLQLAAEAEIVWEGPEVGRFAGAQRLLRLRVVQWRRADNALPLRWAFRSYSPFLERPHP